MKECKLSSLIRNIERMLKLAKSSYTACWTFLATIPTIFQNILFSLIFSLLPQALYYQLIYHDLWMNFSRQSNFFNEFSQNHFERYWNFQNEIIFPSHCAHWIIVWKQIRFNQVELLFYFNGALRISFHEFISKAAHQQTQKCSFSRIALENQNCTEKSLLSLLIPMNVWSPSANYLDFWLEKDRFK